MLSIDEAQLGEAARSWRRRDGRDSPSPQTDVAALAGKIEAEIAQLPEDDAALFMEDLGIAEPSRGRVIRLTYALLGPVQLLHRRRGRVPRLDPAHTATTAVDAAAAIHSDLARGFIRAEVVTYDDLMAAGSMAEARKRGVLRSEGKAYQVRDGDVIEVLFNVSR